MYLCMYVCTAYMLEYIRTYVRMTDGFVCGHSIHILVFSLVGAP